MQGPGGIGAADGKSGKIKKTAVHVDRCRLSKNPWKSSRGPQPSRIPIVPGGVYGGDGTIFASENPIFQSKNRFSAVFAPGNLKDFSKNCVAVATLQEPRPARLNPLDSKAALPEPPLRGGSGALRGWQWRGSLLPRPPACQKDFFDKLRTRPRAGPRPLKIILCRSSSRCTACRGRRRWPPSCRPGADTSAW